VILLFAFSFPWKRLASGRPILYYALMAKEPPSEDSFDSIQKIVEVLRYVVLRDHGLQLQGEDRKARENVDAVVKQYKIPPLRRV
jgi:hypothetical protein